MSITISPSAGLPETRRWLSQAEAGAYLGVTDRTIRSYVRSGVLTGRRLPGSRLCRIDRLEIDTALKPIPSAGPRGAA
jgi:excisionase family DNA binding protein